MITLTITTTTSRKTVIVNGSKTVKEILDENAVDYSESAIHLEGLPLTTSEMGTALGELVAGDTAMLNVIVRQKAGC